MNFLLALIWLALGTALITWHASTGDPRWTFPFRGTPVSVGWVAIALSFYNLVRAWSIRSYQAEERARRIAEASRSRDVRWRERHPSDEPPDPNFDFTDEPPPP
jgi:hypothetical protein